MRREVFTSIGAVDENAWNTVLQDRNVYLSIEYLSALEESMNDEIDFYYTISRNGEGTPVLISVFQLVTFEDKRRKYSKALCKLSYHIHKKIADVFTINVLVSGNVFSDGENGFLWNSISQDEAVLEVAEVVEDLKKEKTIKEKSSIILFKEFWPESAAKMDFLKSKNYSSFMVDVNMVLNIDHSWNSIDDYLNSMKTKFRTKAKGVFKKAESLDLRSLSYEEIEKNANEIDLLFSNVLAKSDFSFGSLKAITFAKIKKALPENFFLTGVYLHDELIGFSTSILNGKVLEANFVGLNYEHNKDLCVYQRLLYNYVEQALSLNVSQLHLGRTAELIKSSIGALPTNMQLYARHRRSVPNLLLKPIINAISPRAFELRPPFKTNLTI